MHVSPGSLFIGYAMIAGGLLATIYCIKVQVQSNQGPMQNGHSYLASLAGIVVGLSLIGFGCMAIQQALQ